MSKKKSIDKFARILSILSFIVALFAVGIPYYQTEKQLEEDISISLRDGCGKNNEIKLINSLGELYGIVQIPYTLTISNNGNRTSSVIDIITHQQDKDGRLSQFSGIEGDIIDNNGNKITLPININSGESKSFTYYIGAFIDYNIYKNLDSLKPINKRLSCKLVTMTLGRIGKDIFNNSISYQEYQNKGYNISVSKTEQRAPIFIIRSTTSRGTEIVSKFSKYKKRTN